jgi:PAS domain S-box-containing protein
MLSANPSIILIVDDQPTNLKMLFSFLLQSGYKVLVAKTGESALQKLQNIAPDLILLDVMMPGLDGFETCRRLKASAETKDIPVIFMTALSEPMDKIKGLKVGAVDYITKPFQQEEVLARIENQLQIRRLQRQLEEQNRQLQQSQLLLTGVLNSSLDGVAAFAAIRDNQGQIIDFKWLLLNPTGETMMAGTASELVGQSLLETRPGFVGIGLFEKYVRVVETGMPLDTEVYYAHETIQAWFQVVAVQLNDGCAVTFRDITERKQMEERNRALLDAIPDMMFRQRVDGTYLDVQAKEGSLLTSPEIFIGTNLGDRPIPDAVKQGIFEHLQAAVETGELQTYEYELPLHDGVHAYEARFVKSGADEAIRIVRDVSERKQAELALRESEARFRGIFESAAIAIGLTTADGTVIAANPTYEVFLGYTEAEMQGLNFAEITHPEDLAVDIALTQELINGARDSFQLEKRYIRKDGQLFWARLTVSAIRNQQGEFQFTIAIIEDINDSKLREFALKESERRFRATFNDSFQFTGLLTPNGTLIEANQTALDFGGVKPTDVINLPFWETSWWREEERERGRQTDEQMERTSLLHPCPETLSSKQEQLREAIQRAASGQFVRYEVDVTGVGDSVLTLDFSIKPIRDETGKVVLLISEGRDITEYKQTREALLMAQKRLEYLLSSSPSIIYTSETIEPYGATFVSENVTTAFGYEPSEFIEDASFWIRHIHPDDTKRILAELPQLFEQGYHEHEYRFLHKDGAYRWVYDALKLIRNEQGNDLEFVGSWLDITERKQIEAAWQESQRWLQAIAEANPNILYVYDLIEQRNVYSNRQMWSILGYKSEDVQQMGTAVLQTLMHPDDFATVCEHFKKFETAKEGEIVEVEYRMRHKNGEWCWLISRETLFTRTADGKPKQVLGAAADISDRKQADALLRQQKELLQKIFDHIPVMLSVYDTDGQLQMVNRELESILGWSGAELRNVDWLTQCYPDPENRQQVFDKMVEPTGKWQDFKTRTRFGTVIDTCWAGIPLSDGTRIGIGQDITERKRVEEALRNSEERLQLAIEGSATGLWDLHISTGQAYFNPRWKTMLGYAIEEIDNSFQSLQRLVHPEDLPKVLAALNDHFEGRSKSYEMEFRMLSKSGEWKWILSQAKVMERDASGKPLRITGTHIDISDRKRAEEALHKSEARLQKLAANVPGMLYEFVGHTDNSYRLAYVSSGCRDIYELEPEQIVENIALIFETIHPDDLNSLYEALETSAETLEPFAWEGRLILRSGKRKWIQGASRPEQQANGDILWHGLLIDISDRKQAEFEIKAAKAALERQIQRVLLHERITQEIRSSLDPKQVFQTAAYQIGEAFGVHRCLIHTYIDHPIPQIPLVAEYKQADLEFLVSVEIPVGGNPHVQLMLAQDQAIASDDVYTDPLLEAASSLCQQLGLKSMLAVRTSYQGKPNGAIGIHQYDSHRHWTDEEISLLESVAAQMGIAIAQANLLEQETQRRQELAAQNQALEKAKLAAEAANRAKSLFLSKMSHELRTPLNAILGFTQVMARNESLTTEQREYLEIINRSGEHLLELINDILSMAKIEAGQITLNENRFDLYCLLDSLEEMLRLKAAAKGLLLIFERANDVPQYVKTDESKLRQVLLNLLGNAIKFTQTGSVTLRVRGGSREENYSTPHSQLSTPNVLIFEVSDTGSGIAPEELDRLFEPFVQTQTGRQSMEGTGLGLPISQQFVRLMGGTLTVSSVVNQGASFTFDIQIGLASSADEKPISSKRRVIGLAPNQPSYRILVVEDAAVNRKLLVKILEPLGFEVRTAANGQEAIVLWESWSPHLIWMDIIMPIMDGYEATQQIKRTPKGQDTIIIALTADAFEEQRDAILRAGCNDFLPKPFQREVLLEKIACYLGVRYIYDDQQSATSVVETHPSGTASPNPQNILKQSLTRDALAVMPAPWITELHQAALYADDERMNQLIEQIPSKYSSLRQALRELLNNFRLEQLITLTEPTAHE